MGVTHGEVVKWDGEKKRTKRVLAVGDGFSGCGVATRTGHRPVSLS